MNSQELESKYQSLLDRIELIKKKVYLRHTIELLDQLREFCSKKNWFRILFIQINNKGKYIIFKNICSR